MSADAAEASCWRDLFVRRYSAPLITLSPGVALHAFNGFLVATALPTAVIEIGGVELMSWAFTVYLVPIWCWRSSAAPAVRG
jgi:hypothetical protein